MILDRSDRRARALGRCGIRHLLLGLAAYSSLAGSAAAADAAEAAEVGAPAGVTTPPALEQASASLDLDHAYDRALATDQAIRSAIEAVAKADLLPWSGLTRLGTRVTAAGRYDKPEHDISSTVGPVRVETRSAGVTVEQPLFDLTAIPAYQAGTIAADAARLDFRFTVRNTLFAVSEAYFEVLKQGRIVEVSDQTLELAKSQLALAERRFQVGEVTKSDVLRARVVVEQARQKQIESENDLRLARHTLASVLNLPESDHLTVSEPPPLGEPLPSLEEAEHAASERREDLRAAALLIQQREKKHHEVLAEYAPRVVGQWSDQWLDPETFSTRSDFWEASVNLEIPLFEGGQREIDLADTDHDTARARLDHERLAKSVDLEVRDAWLGVHTLQETLEALRAQVAAAEENYRDLQNQYRAGEATSLDLQSALTDLGSSRTDLAARTFDLEVALRNLDRAQGRFQEARVERVKIP